MEWELISLVLGIVAIMAGIQWVRVKRLLAETAEALTIISNAVKDNTLTKKEIEAIADEIGDVIATARKLVRRGSHER